jgi:hypothetical protein
MRDHISHPDKMMDKIIIITMSAVATEVMMAG